MSVLKLKQKVTGFGRQVSVSPISDTRHLIPATALCYWHLALLIALYCVGPTRAQDIKTATGQGSTPIVTASATAERLRFVAPGAVVQIRLEVFTENGQTLSDVQVKGNVIDWSLQDGQGNRLPEGGYVCVVTVKSLSGKLSQRVCSLQVRGQEISLQKLEQSQMTPAQQQSIGPVENEAVSILQPGEVNTATTLTHDGTEAALTRSTGALSFRLGDVFSGTDQEQMRLTEAGDLGIGTEKPKARLDVAGTVRAERVLIAKPRNGKEAEAADAKESDQPLASGSGTQDRLAKWTDDLGTLGDSVVIDTGASLQLTAPPSLMQDTNLLYLNSTDATTGILAGSTPSFGAANGPFFAMRGNDFTTIPNQRGLFAIGAGNVANPTGDDGSVKFNTGNDSLRMVIRPDGKVGIGTGNPESLLDVAGNINTSTEYYIDGVRVLSAPTVFNIFVGRGAGNSTTGNFNSFFGTDAGFSNTTGHDNAFFGTSAGENNSSGQDNAFFGVAAGQVNSSGSRNAFFGHQAGNSNIGSDNAMFGYRAGVAARGTNNSFFGSQAGRFNTSGGWNSFFGTFAGLNNSNGSFNSFFGNEAGQANTTGQGNAFFGFQTGYFNTAGSFNAFFGSSAGVLSRGDRNAFFGNEAGYSNGTGTRNSFVGNVSGRSNTSGVDNSFFGQGAGSANTTGSGNIVIGSGAGTGLVSGSNNIYLANAGANESNRIRIGTQGSQTTTFLAGVSGSAVAGSAVVVDANGQLGVAPSTRRFKHNIRDMGNASNKLLQLRPVTFFYRPEFVAGDQTLQYGLIAEEVATVYPELVQYSTGGQPQTVRYQLLNTMLLNEVQKQQRQITSQTEQINTLEKRLWRLEAASTQRRRARRK